MTFRGILLAILTTFMLVGSASAQTFDGDQKKAIENIVREYLLANPEVLLQSVEEYRQRQEMSKQDQVKLKLEKYADVLKFNPGSPVGGNPKGNITVVEFFDYRCPYCKKVFPTVQKLLKEDKNIRYVLKEFPILGPVSVIATRVSLALWAIDPKKYMTYHTSVMTSRGSLDEQRIFKYAKKAGYDVSEVRARMDDPAIKLEIAANMKLAEELGINGTPAFVIGRHVVPGAVDMATLKQLIRATRNN